MRDVKAYFAWHQQIAATGVAVNSRLAIASTGAAAADESTPPDLSRALAIDVSPASGEVKPTFVFAGSISARVPPLSLQSPVLAHTPLTTPFSDRTSTEGSNSLNQSPRAFPGGSPRAMSTFASFPNSPLDGALRKQPAGAVGGVGWSDPWAVGPSRPVSSREEFKSILGVVSRSDDRMPVQQASNSYLVPQPVPQSFSLFGGNSGFPFQRHGDHSLPPGLSQRVSHPQPLHRYQSASPAGAHRPNVPVGSAHGPSPSSRNYAWSMSALLSDLPVFTSNSTSVDRADSRISCVGEGRPQTGVRPSLVASEPLSVRDKDDSLTACDAGASSTLLPGLDANSIWRVRNDEESSHSWSLF